MAQGTTPLGSPEPETKKKKKDKDREKLCPKIFFGLQASDMSKETREFYADVARETGRHRLRAELLGKDYHKGFGAKFKRGLNKKMRLKHVGEGLVLAVVIGAAYEGIAKYAEWPRLGLFGGKEK